MKWLITLSGLTFYIYTYFVGIPFSMTLGGVKTYKNIFMFSTKSKTAVSLMKYSDGLSLSCNKKTMSSRLKTKKIFIDIPIIVESIERENTNSFRNCINLKAIFTVTTTDWLRASFLKGR